MTTFIVESPILSLNVHDLIYPDLIAMKIALPLDNLLFSVTDPINVTNLFNIVMFRSNLEQIKTISIFASFETRLHIIEIACVTSFP